MNRLNVRRIVSALELLKLSVPDTEVFIKASIDEQVKLLQEPGAAFAGDGGPGGQHLAVVRDFIRREAYNGENVSWGSHEYLRLRGLTVFDLEYLATEIAKAVIADFCGRR